jgi:putative hydroxymethylpyrimidine transport system substrate-binding protein
MLLKNGLSLNDVTLINVHYGLTQVLLLKRVDGAIGMMRNIELIQLALLGQQPKAFFPEENGVAPYQELIFVSHREHASDRRINLFIQAVQEAMNYLKVHPEESWTKFVSHHPELNDKSNHDAWFATVKKF